MFRDCMHILIIIQSTLLLPTPGVIHFFSPITVLWVRKSWAIATGPISSSDSDPTTSLIRELMCYGTTYYCYIHVKNAETFPGWKDWGVASPLSVGCPIGGPFMFLNLPTKVVPISLLMITCFPISGSEGAGECDGTTKKESIDLTNIRS